jgi:2,3-bisphosphoglycerate-dependent phosphoglycerate mutase
MPRVIAALLRHGEYHQLEDTPSAWQPFQLTDLGFDQAERAVTLLQGVLRMFDWDLCPIIDSSKLLRGWQTAETIRQGLSLSTATALSLESFDDLAERSMGSAANLTRLQIESILKQDPRFDPPPLEWKSNSHYQLPLQGAESLMQAGERVARHLDSRLAKLQQQVENDTLKLFVGHGAAFRHAAYHLGVMPFEQIEDLSMYHCRPVILERRFAGTWQHLTGDWKVRARGETFAD